MLKKSQMFPIRFQLYVIPEKKSKGLRTAILAVRFIKFVVPIIRFANPYPGIFPTKLFMIFGYETPTLCTKIDSFVY